MTVPAWISDMANPATPHIVAEGPDAGALAFLPADEAARAARTGSHISVVGRDMATFDLEAEKAARPRRAPRAAPQPDEAAATPQEPTAPDADAPKARVGRYANRAMVTKPGERN